MPPPSLNRLRFFGLLFPPAGLVLLWFDREAGPWKKVFRTLFLLLYSVLYAALIVVVLIQFFGLHVEWRGGFPPVLTFHKTVPNYEAVESHRARQASVSANPPAPTVSAYWTDFRGPNRDGHYQERSIRTRWPAGGPRLHWRQPIGGGYASFVVAGGVAFTIEQRRNQEAVTAYEAATGRELWAHPYEARFEESMGGEGPRATPTWHEGRIYSLGALGNLICLNADNGELIWKRNILRESGTEWLYYGLSASPLIVDEKVIVLGGIGGDAVLVFNKFTGEPIWKSLNEKPAYASPMLVTLAGRRQLFVVTAARAVGLNMEDGQPLWSFPWAVAYDNAIAQPVVLGPNRFLLSAGYGTGCAAVEVSATGMGYTTRQLWRNKFLKNKFSSSVFWQGHIYGLDEDMLTCLDAATGERKWKDGRYGYGQLLLASGHLIVLTGNGELALVRAAPERHEELARFPALHGKTWNHPALADGRLLVRNAVEMACYDLSE
ncbi:MAG TPA: PQQ-binding-like beta-propeller repeat protein [Verrucomicrobiae bacterium]|jgi:outer membrane protein assembly factor BamB